jgi:hypothetical protein
MPVHDSGGEWTEMQSSTVHCPLSTVHCPGCSNTRNLKIDSRKSRWVPYSLHRGLTIENRCSHGSVGCARGNSLSFHISNHCRHRACLLFSVVCSWHKAAHKFLFVSSALDMELRFQVAHSASILHNKTVIHEWGILVSSHEVNHWYIYDPVAEVIKGFHTLATISGFGPFNIWWLSPDHKHWIREDVCASWNNTLAAGKSRRFGFHLS